MILQISESQYYVYEISRYFADILELTGKYIRIANYITNDVPMTIFFIETENL